MRRLERELEREQQAEREADLYAISQIEKNVPRGDSEEGHRPDDEPLGAERDVHVGPGRRPRERSRSEDFWLDSRRPFQPTTTGSRTTPPTSCAITVNGDKGTLHFECHYVDVKTGKVAAITAADQDVARIERPVAHHEHGGRRPAEPEPVSQSREASRRRSGGLSPADNPLVRAVGRLPAKVHTKLLVAFVGTALLVVVVGVLGLRVLGQSNDRVETLGALQERAVAYGKLQSDAAHVRLLLAENVGRDFYKV